MEPMYRLEKILDYTVNKTRCIDFVAESGFFEDLEDKLVELAALPHFGKYQIVKVEPIANEHTTRAKVKDNKSEL